MSWRVLFSVDVERPPVTVYLWRKMAESSMHGQLQLEMHGLPESVVAELERSVSMCQQNARDCRNYGWLSDARSRRGTVALYREGIIHALSFRQWTQPQAATASTCCQLNCRYVETAIAFLIHLLQILETINNWKWWASVSKCRRSVHSQLPFVVIHVSLFNIMLPIKGIFTGAVPPMAEWPIIMNGNIFHIVILHRKHSIHHHHHYHQYF